jgi:hypothetical protein
MTAEQKLALIKRHAPSFKLEPYQYGGSHGWCATVKINGKPYELSEVGPAKFSDRMRSNIIQCVFEDDRVVPRHARLSA